MKRAEVMRELKAAGTAQNVKIYKRHGAQEPMFGVSFANLNKLKKKIKVDHGLAAELWESGNMDARTLALMIADPAELTSKAADAWMKDVDYYLLGDMLGSLVAKASFAKKKLNAWCRRKGEHPKQIGYCVAANMLMNDADQLNDDECRELVGRIESEIHDSPNRAKHSMNNALIAIGVAKATVRDEVYAAAKNIGQVDVDHGETSCKTPDAVAYIKKTLAHHKKKKVAKKKAVKKKTAKKRAKV